MILMVMIFDKRLFMNLAAASVSFSPLSPHTPLPLPTVHKRLTLRYPVLIGSEIGAEGAKGKFNDLKGPQL